MKDQINFLIEDNTPQKPKNPLQPAPLSEVDPTIFGDWQHKGKVTDF